MSPRVPSQGLTRIWGALRPPPSPWRVRRHGRGHRGPGGTPPPPPQGPRAKAEMPRARTMDAMIGAFARMLGNRDRVLTFEQTADNAYSVRTRDEAATTSESRDQPPEQFVERIPHEGGDVVFAPILETLRAVLKGRKAGGGTLRPMPHKEDAPQGGR